MATKASAQTTTSQATVMNFKDMDFDALIKEEQELKAKQDAIAEAKKARAEALKAGAYTEIREAIQKYFDTVLTREEITTFLNDHEYIMPMVTQAPAGAKVGRRKIDDKDILFSDEYTSAKGGRKMKFKMDELTDKVTGGAKDFYNTLKDQSFEQLKPKFKDLFWKFATKEDGKVWTKQHFAHIYDDLMAEAEKKAAPKEQASA